MFRIGAGTTLFAVNAGVVTTTGGINIGVAATIKANGNATFTGIANLLTLLVMVKD